MVNLLLLLVLVGSAVAAPQYDDDDGDWGGIDDGDFGDNSTVTTAAPVASTTAASIAVTTQSSTTYTTVTGCGKKKAGTRVIGGKNAEVNEYPWMAVVMNSDTKTPKCGGAVINSKWIATAQHCVTDGDSGPKAKLKKNSELTITVGDCKRGAGRKCTSNKTLYKEFAVEKIERYKKNGKVMKTDLALIKVKGVIDTKIYTPICLPDAGFAVQGKNIVLIGWGLNTCKGKTEDCKLGNSFPANLQELTMPVISSAACLAKGGPVNAICYGGQKGKSGCGGDSGSPVMYNNNGKFTLAASVSGATGTGKCGDTTLYGSAYEVAKHRAWYKKIAGV